MTIAAIPSPSTAVWYVGPVPIRAYALCIVLGIVVACLVTEARLRRRGAQPYATLDVAVWAVPFGIVGARIYHVITSPQAYFGADGDPMNAFKIWEGGLGIWGAVAGGALGAWLGCRQLGIPLGVFADALAPGLPLAQAVGRLGNWFNNELYGGPTDLPWGLRVHQMDPDNPGMALRDADGGPRVVEGLFHPTFAYEALWNVGVALLVFVADRRFKLGRGRAFALYVAGYTAGRFWIEMMRTDPANEIFGARVNVWVSALVFLGSVAYLLLVKGPRGYLLPAGEPDPRGRVGNRLVTEEEFLAATGGGSEKRPADDRAGDGPADDRAGEGPDSPVRGHDVAVADPAVSDPADRPVGSTEDR